MCQCGQALYSVGDYRRSLEHLPIDGASAIPDVSQDRCISRSHVLHGDQRERVSLRLLSFRQAGRTEHQWAPDRGHRVRWWGEDHRPVHEGQIAASLQPERFTWKWRAFSIRGSEAARRQSRIRGAKPTYTTGNGFYRCSTVPAIGRCSGPEEIYPHSVGNPEFGDLGRCGKWLMTATYRRDSR